MADTVVREAGTTNLLYSTNERPIDMYKKMYESYPGLTPLLSITTKVSSDETSQSTIRWINSRDLPKTLVVTADVAIAAGTITSSQYTYARKNDIYYYPTTGERLRVTATPSSSAIAVTKGWGASDDLAIPAGATLIKLSPAYEENTADINPRMAVNEEEYNLTQEFDKHTRHSWRTMNESTYFGGKGTKRTEDNQKMVRDAKIELELNLWFQTLGNATGTTYYIKTARGIEEVLRSGSNFVDMHGLLTESKLDGTLADISSEWPDTPRLLGFGSHRVMNIINQIAKPLIRLSPNSKEYGLKLNQYNASVDADLVPCPLFNMPTIREWLFLIDLNYVTIVYQKRPMLELNVTKDGGRYTTDRFYGLVTLRFAQEARHIMMVNIKG